jgi:hypothetical protein
MAGMLLVGNECEAREGERALYRETDEEEAQAIDLWRRSRKDEAPSALSVLVVMLAVPLFDCTAHGGPSKAETTLANMAKDVVTPGG